jgi:hypothetical protein
MTFLSHILFINTFIITMNFSDDIVGNQMQSMHVPCIIKQTKKEKKTVRFVHL